MPRKEFPEDEPWSSPRGAFARAEIDVGEAGDLEPRDNGVLDLQREQESPFLRTQKRVPVRRGPLPKKTAVKLMYVLEGVAALLVLAAACAFLYRYGRNSWRFRLESSDQIQVTGNQNVSRAQILQVFGPDISRNVFAIPLGERKMQLERLPWVESAVVMRQLPNRVSVQVQERTPIAFAQLGPRVALVDAGGVLMPMPVKARQKLSFPVIVGLSESDPLSKRAASLQLYRRLVRDLDAGGANYSRDLDQVDLGNPEDVKITVADPRGEVLIHLGASSFLERYKIFVAHVQEWRQQFQRLDSVDLRYDRQVIVNPDAPRTVAVAPAKTAAAKPAHAQVKSAKLKSAKASSRWRAKAAAMRRAKANAAKLQAKAAVPAKRSAPQKEAAQASSGGE